MTSRDIAHLTAYQTHLISPGTGRVFFVGNIDWLYVDDLTIAISRTAFQKSFVHDHALEWIMLTLMDHAHAHGSCSRSYFA